MLLPIFESVARVGVAILLNSLWQGALIAFVAWLALRIFASANASTRYLVWALALAAVVIVPVATSLSRISIDHPATQWTAQTSPSSSAVKHAASHVTTEQAAPVKTEPKTPAAMPEASDAVAAPNAAERLPSLHFTVPALAAAIAFGVWLLAALVVLVRLAIGLVTLERLKRDALPLAVDYRDAMPRWEAALKGHRDVRICVSDNIEVPVAVGLFDAMILLPSHLVRELDPSEIDQISLHELAHLLRSDDWTNGLQRIASALLFFNPAVLFIARQLDIEREVACDDFVLGLTGAVRPYAFCLTKMAEMTAWPHRAVAAPGVFVTRKSISIRIERLLRTGRTIGSTIAPTVAASVTVALLAIFLVLRTMTPSIAFSEFPAAISPPAPVNAAWPSDTPVHVAHAVQKPVVHVARPMPPAVPETKALVQQKSITIQRQVQKAVTESVHKAKHAYAYAMPAVSADAIASAVGAAMDAAGTGHAEHSGMSCVGCDYANANLANKDFTNRAMEGANFAHADLHGSRFDHAMLTGANFKDADLRGASFVGANLEGCNMKGAQLAGARFDGAQLTGCDIDARSLSPEQARIVLTACQGCNFGHADLHGMDLRNVHLEGADLAYADLRNADLRGAMFTGVTFSHAQLSGARVDNADFIGCDFSGTDLRNVDLSKASITGSDMGAAIMRR
ncbi:MAG TPA: pentapeptide repeat-containing protein [Candidatus Baltobacteraceae bacterium]|jgi:beta-lactamase regulating signal transducer with metallopeptidase domain|nr:pentapeptide repeat-containing protein [Candidatus Baltobacteraceae bacterium]